MHSARCTFNSRIQQEYIWNSIEELALVLQVPLSCCLVAILHKKFAFECINAFCF